jgi:hypothetical protein
VASPTVAHPATSRDRWKLAKGRRENFFRLSRKRLQPLAQTSEFLGAKVSEPTFQARVIVAEA